MNTRPDEIVVLTVFNVCRVRSIAEPNRGRGSPRAYPLSRAFLRAFSIHRAPQIGRPDLKLGRLVSLGSPQMHLSCTDRRREGCRESRRCSRDTYPESCITKYASIRRSRVIYTRMTPFRSARIQHIYLTWVGGLFKSLHTVKIRQHWSR